MDNVLRLTGAVLTVPGALHASLISAVALGLIWLLYCAIWRLYLTPIAHFPGPKLAALTYCYEFYYDVIKPGGGLFLWKLEQLHEEYGPIVRINPSQLHISDPEFHSKIYSGSTVQRDKLFRQVRSSTSTLAVGFTVDHYLHRLRRKAIDELFTKQSIARLECLMKAKTERLCERLQGLHDDDDHVNLTVAYLAVCMDVITTYTLGLDYGLLDRKNFNDTTWKETIHSLMKSLSPISHLGTWTVDAVTALPKAISRNLLPDLHALLNYKWVSLRQKSNITHQISAFAYFSILQWVQSIIRKVVSHQGIYSESSDSPRCVMTALRDHPKLPPIERSFDRLSDEATILLVAGSETPAKVLAIIHFHLLDKPSIFQRARAELQTIMSETNSLPPLSQLEKLPYLTAVVKEGLRLHCGVVGRPSRISPNEPLMFNNWYIPAGTPLSMSSYFLHYNPILYPNPREFDPGRWLEARKDKEGNDVNLEKYFHPFGRGSRICLGYNFAYAIMYIVLAAVIPSFDMELKDTDLSDVDLERDWFVPQPRWGSDGVKARIIKAIKK